MRDMDYGVKLVTRAEWGARAPTSVTPLNPSYGATRHWEGPHMGSFPHSSCATKVRGIQDFHMGSQRGWTDIAYTGVVCPHGYVFEGRSLWVRTAANGTNTGNNTAYAFCYLGGEGDPFTEAGKRGMKAAMNWTRDWGGAGPHRNDHNDWKPTQCPGTVIEAWGDSGEPITFEEDDLPTPADLWNHPLKNAGKGEGGMSPAGELLTFAHFHSFEAVGLIQQMAAVLAKVPEDVWGHELWEEINEIKLSAGRLLEGAHTQAFYAANPDAQPDS